MTRNGKRTEHQLTITSFTCSVNPVLLLQYNSLNRSIAFGGSFLYLSCFKKNKSEQFVNIRCESENRVNTDMQQIYFSLIYHKSERKMNLSKQDDKAIALCSYQDKSNSLQFKMAPSFIQNNLSLQY